MTPRYPDITANLIGHDGNAFIRGIGLRTADLIAEKLGIEKTAMIRVRAEMSFTLTEAMGDRHYGLPRAELIGLAGKLLDVTRTTFETELD